MTDFCGEGSSWLTRLAWIVGFLAALTLLAAFIRFARYSRNGLRIQIGGNRVEVVVDDLFKADGIKVIPFNEYFDTKVDNKVISKGSLNGKFIEQHADWETLQRTVGERQPSIVGEPKVDGGRLRYPLGTVKTYGDYALLAFTHMDEMNRAHFRHGQYEGCLFNMWADLNRMYAGKKVVLPLLGSGITRFEGGKPSNDDLLRCMLCTLRSSGQCFREGVQIVLTEETAKRMKLYEVEDYAGAWKKGIGEKDGL